METNRQPRRDVRTLLFGKIPPFRHSKETDSRKAHDNLYGMIHKTALSACAPKHRDSVCTFLTFGGYDALCIYPPALEPNDFGWLHDVYKDKQKILREPTNDIIYHQMHLVSEQQDTMEFWKYNVTDYPFLLVTVIYGVNVAESEQFPKPPADGTGSSIYERRLRQYLYEYCSTDSVRFAVYNGITVGDAIVLWRVSDLNDALEMITRIEFSGLARKTLTTLGFPVDSGGRVLPCVRENLIKNLHKSLAVSMHGSVRDIDQCMKITRLLAEEQSLETTPLIKSVFQNLIDRSYEDGEARARLRGLLPNGTAMDEMDRIHNSSKTKAQYLDDVQTLMGPLCRDLCSVIPNYHWTQSLGKSDFAVTARISYANLANLLEAYRDYHLDLSSAYWEFLTDIKENHPLAHKPWFGPSQLPTNVLCNLYQDFQTHCSTEEGEWLRDFSWYNAFQELLGTHHYIDHHPVLHGPSYLVHISLKILYAYFSGGIPDYEKKEKRLQLLKRSEENMIGFIQSLDQLTEQISRNDDAILNQRCNTHTIHFALPESALEFYHAFLRRIVDYVMCYDERKDLVPFGFEYDFLLSPKICSRFRCRPVLRTDHSDHSYLSGKVWPLKQAYVLELPLESIFNPIRIFIPFVHECFHCFGDALRQRSLRKKYMSLFIASNLLNAVSMDGPNYKVLSTGITRMIYESDTADTDSYMAIVWQQLANKTHQLIETESLEVLSRKFGGQVSDDVLIQWNAEKEKLLALEKTSYESRITVVDAILTHCRSYFSECYADAMSIALLRLTPCEYLGGFQEELRSLLHVPSKWMNPTESRNWAEHQSVHMAQRFAIVLAVCCKHPRLSYFTFGDCRRAIERYSTSLDSSVLDDGYCKFSDTLMQNFEALTDPYTALPPGSCLHPPVSLQYVIEYLSSCIELLYCDPPKMKVGSGNSQNYVLDQLAYDFDTIIRKGNMFGEQFYNMIYEHHDNIRKQSKRQT